ncbi:DNA cytosine methyltransferase [Geodermatophilus amargosae]|uniref:DNA cytosine methyltransferase n=1 Tax=Geodermatophilus amargosae TaxID=1296565 RepID=UPI0034DFEE40
MTDLSVVEICAGAGGQSLGLHLAGFRHELAIELDPAASATLQVNFARLLKEEVARDLNLSKTDPSVSAEAERRAADLVRTGDVADVDVWDPAEHKGVALLAGGVPCPPFSIAGKQLGATDERDLFAWAVELAGRMKPQAVLLENVRGLSSPRFAAYRQAVIDRFEDFGYVADWELLEARDFGVPQLRPRFVLVALKRKFAPYFEWPEGKPTQETVGSALLPMMEANGWPGAADWAADAKGIAPTIVGGSKKHGGADLGPTRAKRAWAALGVDGHGLADTAPDEDFVVPAHGRGPKLTCEMVQRLQGWSGPEYEQWVFTGRKTSRYRQIGNAFPPPVARAVGSSIASALRMEGDPARLSAERKMHDEVYRLLRDHGGWLTADRIYQLVGGRLSIDEIAKRVQIIGRDFDIETRARANRVSWRLGEFKAFRGQEDHQRHAAFVERRSRSRIS